MMIEKKHYLPIFSLIVAIATLAFVLYSVQQQRAIYDQIKVLNAETAEVLKYRALLAAQVDLPRPSSIVSCIDSTERDPMKNEGKEYVVKTTCRNF